MYFVQELRLSLVVYQRISVKLWKRVLIKYWIFLSLLRFCCHPSIFIQLSEVESELFPFLLRDAECQTDLWVRCARKTSNGSHPGEVLRCPNHLSWFVLDGKVGWLLWASSACPSYSSWSVGKLKASTSSSAFSSQPSVTPLTRKLFLRR